MNMKTFLHRAGLVLVLQGLCMAAPLPPMGPFDLSGQIEAVRWFPEEFVPGIPGMSGSAGVDRIRPAHFRVKMNNFNGVDATVAQRLSCYIHWPDSQREDSASPLLLKLNHKDPEALQEGMKIKIQAYTLAGDEGGIWTGYQALEILGDVL